MSDFDYTVLVMPVILPLALPSIWVQGQCGGHEFYGSLCSHKSTSESKCSLTLLEELVYALELVLEDDCDALAHPDICADTVSQACGFWAREQVPLNLLNLKLKSETLH